jgi:hypothetical protein
MPWIELVFAPLVTAVVVVLIQLLASFRCEMRCLITSVRRMTSTGVK